MPYIQTIYTHLEFVHMSVQIHAVNGSSTVLSITSSPLPLDPTGNFEHIDMIPVVLDISYDVLPNSMSTILN